MRADELSIRRLLAGLCPCAKNMTKSKEGSCYLQFQDAVSELLVLRGALDDMHKLDVDRFVFDALHDLAVSQGIIEPLGSAVKVSSAPGSLNYVILGKPVCRRAYQRLLGIGSNKLHSIHFAVVTGKQSPPLDMRYISKPLSCPSATTSNIVSYLQSLYDSVAETLPDKLDELCKADDVSIKRCPSPVVAEADPYALEIKVGRTTYPSMFGKDDSPSKKRLRGSVHLDACGPVCDRVEKLLPPGNFHDQWEMYTVVTGTTCAFSTFWRIWRTQFPHLKFRQWRQHACCSICIRYKLLIRGLTSNIVARQTQLRLYHKPLQRQFGERLEYWMCRGRAINSMIQFV